MINSNAPAFPQTEYSWQSDHEDPQGLTKREYFAALAMQGICAKVFNSIDFQGDSSNIARVALECADALIEELNK